MTTKRMNSSTRVNPSVAKLCQVVTLDELHARIKKRKANDVHVLVTGDCHLGSRAVPTRNIVNALDKATSSEILKYTDSVIINGDLIDRRISLASDEAQQYIDFAMRLLLRCSQNEVSLDVLEGTPSHDNGQPALMAMFAKHMAGNGKIPLRYIDDITIIDLLQDPLKNSPWGYPLKALFIPDEISPDSTTTWRKVTELLRLQNLEQVDQTYIHGMMRYQEPMYSEKSHVEENYLGITKYRIAINHWHLPSAKDRIVAPGSIERMRHGEEETKGFYYTILSKKGAEDFFVINPVAAIFETLDITGCTLTEINKQLDRRSDYPVDSRIRLKMSRKDEGFSVLSEIKRQYDKFKITELIEDTADIAKIDIALTATHSGISVNSSNVQEMLQPYLSGVGDDLMGKINELIGGQDES